MRDDLGDRMKSSYENRARYSLPRRTYTIIRLDGKAFHTFTSGMERPFSEKLMNMMDNTAIALCKEIQGVEFAYVQSDEISLLLTDFEKITTESWFDGTIQKIASVSASIATRAFNEQISESPEAIQKRLEGIPIKYALFDSRCFTIPDSVEVQNYFVWRQQDAVRNSIQMVGQANFSAKQLHNVACDQIQELLYQEKGINWNDFPSRCKRGTCVIKQPKEGTAVYINKDTKEMTTTSVVRNPWETVDTPIFTANPEWLDALIPKH